MTYPLRQRGLLREASDATTKTMLRIAILACPVQAVIIRHTGWRFSPLWTRYLEMLTRLLRLRFALPRVIHGLEATLSDAGPRYLKAGLNRLRLGFFHHP